MPSLPFHFKPIPPYLAVSIRFSVTINRLLPSLRYFHLLYETYCLRRFPSVVVTDTQAYYYIDHYYYCLCCYFCYYYYYYYYCLFINVYLLCHIINTTCQLANMKIIYYSRIKGNISHMNKNTSRYFSIIMVLITMRFEGEW